MPLGNKEIKPGLQLLSPVRIANTWLLTDEQDRRFLIDSSMFLERIQLRAALAKAGVVRQGDLTAVLLTHRHLDHAGNAAWLRKTFDCPVICHPADAPALTGEVSPPALCRGVGMFFQEWLCKVEDRFPARTPVDELYHDGPWKWGFRIYHTPGHTEGSVMLYHEPSQILFSGDSIVAGIAPFRSFEIINTAFPAFSLDAQSCHQAVREFIREAPPIEVLCSGHGPVVRGPISEKLKRLEEIQ